DITRRYYLIGREVAIDALVAERGWMSLVEVGPGTGRNLRKLQAARPEARYGGVEASDEMLTHARGKCPWATLVGGFAEDADIRGLLGSPPDRIFFSYCLSMVQEPHRALEHARRSLAPGGEVVVVDFGDLSDLGRFKPFLRKWLDSFHVHSLPADIEPLAFDVQHGRGRYWTMMRFGPLDENSAPGR
ncbi:MAG: class I SAM-dependent methyltransferase, partial [Myxococcota bacterium]